MCVFPYQGLLTILDHNTIANSLPFVYARLAECILETQKDLVASGLHGPLVGHVGDGNFHMLLILDPK